MMTDFLFSIKSPTGVPLTNITITEDAPAWNGSRGYRINMDIRGATYRELQELADWLQARAWSDAATAIREHHFEDHNREGV